MNIYFNRANNQLVGLNGTAPTFAFKRRGGGTLVLYFLDEVTGLPVALPDPDSNLVIEFGLKSGIGSYASALAVYTSTFAKVTTSPSVPRYVAELNFNTDEINALFTSDTLDTVPVRYEISYHYGAGRPTDSNTLTGTVANDIIRGGEPLPGPGAPLYPLAPTANTLLGGSADGLTWIQRTAAQVRTLLSFSWLEGLSLDTDGTLAANSDVKIPSQKAVKTAIATEATARSAEIAAAIVGLSEIVNNAFDASGNPNYPAATKGQGLRISVAGKVGGASGKVVDVDDIVVCLTDNAGGTQVAVGASWVVTQGNLVAGVDYMTPGAISAAFQPLEDQRLSTSDSPTFAEGSFASLFDGTGGFTGLAAFAGGANAADADGFFSGIGGGGTWGTPTFDATNLSGTAISLNAGSASYAYASSATASDFFLDSGWGTPTFDATNLTGTPAFDGSNLSGTASGFSVGFATSAYVSSSSAEDFFYNGGGWGFPNFDAVNLFGSASGLTVGYADAPSYDADTFFGVNWGSPTFDASNLFGYAPSLACNISDATSLLNAAEGNPAVMIGEVPYYPHVTAGVLTLTDTP